MSAPADAAVRTSEVSPSRDERLVPYSVIAFGSLTLMLITGRAELVALAVPFLLALAVGMRRSQARAVRARLVLDTEEVLEGDPVTGHVELEWDGRFDAELVLHRLKGVAALEPPAPDGRVVWTLPAGAGVAVCPFRLRATRWGRHNVGEVWLRLRTPFALLSWTGCVAIGPALRVLPTQERLDRLLDPAEARTVLGSHRSRRLGEGHEFAEVRPYTPGDRLRDLNWSATARHRLPFVNRHHPELSGDVVIAIDTFADGAVDTTVALARAARAAWALARVHLEANDRVGLVGLGGRTQWLPPAGGRRAKFRLLQTLLSVGGEVTGSPPAEGGGGRTAVPASALVVALTSLYDARIVATLQGWRAHGRAVVAIRIETRDLLAAPASEAEALARRVWAIELKRNERLLTDVGIPVVPLAADGLIAPVVSALRRARRAPAVRPLRSPPGRAGAGRQPGEPDLGARRDDDRRRPVGPRSSDASGWRPW